MDNPTFAKCFIFSIASGKEKSLVLISYRPFLPCHQVAQCHQRLHGSHLVPLRDKKNTCSSHQSTDLRSSMADDRL